MGLRIDVTLKNYRCFPDSSPARFIIDSDYTAFVGPNNSGKSSLLRFFYEFRELLNRLGQPSSLRSLLAAVQGDHFPVLGVADQDEVFSAGNNRPLILELSAESDELTPAPPGRIGLVDGVRATVPRATRRPVVELIGNSLPSLEGLGDDGVGYVGQTVFDLRALVEAARTLSQGRYLTSFRRSLSATGGTYYDLEVGQNFVGKWDRMKSGDSQSDRKTALALTADIREVFGFDSLEINASQDNSTLHVTINDNPFRLEEVGAGIVHYIVGLVFAATTKPAMLFIDEPELSLHPALQTEFLRSLAVHTRRGVAFATHSVGLARASGARVYSVRQVQQGESQVRPYGQSERFAELLGEMSFSAYQEMGFRKLLLVEGSTDAQVFRELLRLAGKDHEVVVMSLGGSDQIKAQNEEQLVEVKRITEDVAVLIDSERGADGEPLAADRAAFVSACEELGFDSHATERRATENYLTDKAVKAVKGGSYRGLGPFERLREVEPAWSKNENWRIAREMSASDLASTDLGAFLTAL